MPRCPPILKRPSRFTRIDGDEDNMTPRKPWTAYLGPLFLVFLMLVPQPSWIVLVSSQYISSTTGLIHITVTTILTILAINSLAICTFRDPGRPTMDDLDSDEAIRGPTLTVDHFDDEDEAFLWEDDEDPNDFNSARKWCRTCWAPKPDRAHHCSSCGRCVLRMDHHCPWVSQCVGHRTHAAFLHLLTCITLLSLYIGINAVLVLYAFLFAPVAQPVQDTTALHCLFLVILGLIFAMVIGSFLGFHIYLAFTNQTTLEQLSPFILLKYLPKPKEPRHAPGTSITQGTTPSTTSREVPRISIPGQTDEPPHYFPSPPATPPPPPLPLDTFRHVLLAANPLSTIPRSTPETPSDISPGRVIFSSSPVATTAGHNSLPRSMTGYHEWDEHSLSFAQRRLVRRTADRIGLWDLGWRRNVIATLGSGDPSYRSRGTRSREDEYPTRTMEEGVSLTGSTSATRDRPQHRSGSGGGGSNSTYTRLQSGSRRTGLIKPYSWRWWLAVLFNGGPPRGDGRTYLRNPKARAALEELRRGLEEAEWRERGDASEQARVRNDLAAAPVRGPRHGRPSGRTEDDMELHEI